MNNITQIKRGSTASWALGPEMVHWEDLDVWGKDSLIHCEGIDLSMNVYTTSANYFYDENGQLEDFKRPGLWLIQRGEIQTNPQAKYAIKLNIIGPTDCWLEVVDTNGVFQGQKFYLSQDSGAIEVPYLENFGLYIRWPEQREKFQTAHIKLSIREVNAYEELEPGQLGLEYTNDGQTKLKAGLPGVFKWNELPYVGGDSSNIQYIEQELTTEQQLQARKNIGAISMEQVEELAQLIQSDWNVEDPNQLGYIKNKPFGYVKQTILFDKTITMGMPDAQGNCYYYFDQPLSLINGKTYFIKNYDQYVCQNGYIRIDSTPICIYPNYIVIEAGSAGGMSYSFTIIDPEPGYNTIASEYLPLTNLAEIGNNNPITSHGVANIVNSFQIQMGNINEALDTILEIQNDLITG